MTKKKIIFIINSAQNQRCIKRVNEFVNQGYEVKAYAFTRGEMMRNDPNFELEILGHFTIESTYISRVKLMFTSIRRVIKKHKSENPIFYLFSLDIALLFRLQCGRRYIYEESDLVHTYMRSRLMISIFEKLDKMLIKKSMLSVFTSEGFINYHFGSRFPQQCFVVPNRLSLDVVDVEASLKKDFDINHLSIGFVGGARFDSVYNFIEVFCKSFPQGTFHVFGNPVKPQQFEPLKKYSNCIFHGAFKNPKDLPSIYSQIDLVLSTYDVIYENVRYAEPNKIYEAIYFDTPIIVSEGTFLAQKVNKLGIGYAINALDDEGICRFIRNLSVDSYKEKIGNIKRIDKKEALNINISFFEKLKVLLNRE